MKLITTMRTEILTSIHDDHLWSPLEWGYAWPCWSFWVRVYLRWTWTPSRRVFHYARFTDFHANMLDERVLNLSTLLSLHSIHHLPVFFRNCLERFSWIWRSMASTEPTSLHLFRGGNYDIIICQSPKLFASCENAFKLFQIDRLFIICRLLLSREIFCCHVVLRFIMTSIFISQYHRPVYSLILHS